MDKETILKFLTSSPEERARIKAALDAQVARGLRRAGASEERVQAAMADIIPMAKEAESQLPAQDRLKLARLRTTAYNARRIKKQNKNRP